ncbi:acyl-CoA dehydrogenase family protein [Vagococcus xieshaowenii]|uniref:Glutaryl-CoA dehydrogenase n=1 Tax=Vagococcus xieshaowenii TaxID=2562451 RepID=A0A4Z0D434_9ENTE|nr:acyl-CoA dehydrogenase family protein [Vagococcus xieshaowenii]QCA28102.1 glutaryl-CoA dehydrogenase [Vagococcus xieshaowenii]TFZ40145.1 glutaryl-CoA dehydrogenase [Vagococcus xieshaowenii]
MARSEKLKEMYPFDMYAYANGLTEGELTVLQNLRHFLETDVKPVVNEYWEKADFPFEIFKGIAETGIMNSPLLFEGREGARKPSELYNAFLYFELAKLDASIATFYTVHGGLCYNTILLGGSEAQIEKYAPKIASWEWQGCFGLTEPDHGSDIAGGLATTAEKVGDKWIINGEKRWIGGASTADILPIFARDKEDGKIKCFIVKGGSKGLTVENIKHKVSLRLVQNGHITLENVEVLDEDRLENVNGFKDVARILRSTRADIAHLATGMTIGATEAALKYIKDRDQFGRKLSGFQLVQEKVARMQANVVSTMAYSVQLANMQEQGHFLEENSALAKMHNAMRMRETVAWGREVCGGNGITLETDVARFFADGEAIYSYEGTHEINALIVGRFLTGVGAFV